LTNGITQWARGVEPGLAIPQLGARLRLPCPEGQTAVTNPPPSVPLCSICKKPIELETSKTDSHGEAVHEECYFQKLKNALEAKVPPKHSAD
jgi:hypothetical protein